MLVIKVHEWFMNFNTSKIQSIVVIKQVHVPGQLFRHLSLLWRFPLLAGNDCQTQNTWKHKRWQYGFWKSTHMITRNTCPRRNEYLKWTGIYILLKKKVKLANPSSALNPWTIVYRKRSVKKALQKMWESTFVNNYKWPGVVLIRFWTQSFSLSKCMLNVNICSYMLSLNDGIVPGRDNDICRH